MTTSPPSQNYPIWTSTPSTSYSHSPEDRAAVLARQSTLDPPFTNGNGVAAPIRGGSGRSRPGMASRVSSGRKMGAGVSLVIGGVGLDSYDEGVA